MRHSRAVHSGLAICLALLVLGSAVSCSVLKPMLDKTRWKPKEGSRGIDGLLQNPGSLNEGRVAVDIYMIRIPEYETASYENLWTEIDEQHFSPELRQNLSRNGMRIGLLGGQIPAELSRIIEQNDSPQPSGENDGATLTTIIDPNCEPMITRRHIQLAGGRPIEIKTVPKPYDVLPLLLNGANGPYGESLEQAVPILCMKAFPEPGGSVRVLVLPEIQYGQPRVNFTTEQGASVMVTKPDSRTFPELTARATLNPGHMIVIGSYPNARGTLGAHFFNVEQNGTRQQKLVLIRLAQTRHDDLFSISN